MPVRVLTCGSCGHKPRLGSPVCGRCHRPTPRLNQWGMLITLGLVAGLLAALVLIP